jgi:hypothetical protein
MDEQKEREIESLNTFLDLIDLEHDDINPDESPDFLINIADSMLGIEVTEIFQPPPEKGIYLQEQESIKRDIINNSQEKLDQLEIPKLDIYVSFNDEFRINIDTSIFALSKNNRYDFPEIIADIVTDNIPDPNSEIEIYGVECEKLPIQINSLTIRRQKYYTKLNIGTSHGGILPPLDNETLGKTILKKNKKIDEYYKKCDQCWLLMASNSHKFEKLFDMDRSKSALEACYEFAFDKVYFLDQGSENIHEIKLCT